MPDPTTTNINLATPTHGSDVDTWDVPLNSNSNILDSAFGSITSKSLSNVTVTLTATEAQASILSLSGVLTGNVTVNVAAIRKEWNCRNFCTGNFVVTISGGSGNVVCLPPGQTIKVQWDGTNCSYTDLPHFIGEYWDDSGVAVPAWVTSCTIPPYLACDGSTFSAVTYPYLNTKLGGTTLPDARGRARFTLNGGTSRITTAGSGIDGNTLLSSGGAETITLDTTMIPAHTHTDSGHTHGPQSGGSPAASGFWTDQGGGGFSSGSGNRITIQSTTGSGTANIQNTGGGLAHSNMPPTYIGGITMIRAA